MKIYNNRIKHDQFIGTQIGSVTITEFSHEKELKDRYRYFYKYRCECGNEGISSKNSLLVSLLNEKKTGNKTFCCLNCKKKKLSEWAKVHSIRYEDPEDSHVATVFSNYKSRAKKKGLNIDLDFNEFKCLIKQNCFFCNQEPQNMRKDFTKKRIGLSRGKLNGLDRVDSTKGYLKNNVIPCCEDCNKAKRNLSVSDFLIMIKNIYENLNLVKNIEGNPFKYTIEAFGH
jgi:hypothetical protein